jgi:hypothetical protein
VEVEGRIAVIEEELFAITGGKGPLTVEPLALADVCGTCGRPISPDPFAQVRVAISGTSRLLDFMHVPPVYVASDSFLQFFRTADLVGLKWSRPIGLRSLYRIAPAVFISFAGERSVCKECGQPFAPSDAHWDLAGSTWAGEHFFAFEPYPTALFCSGSARMLLESSGLRGMVFVDPAAIPVD